MKFLTAKKFVVYFSCVVLGLGTWLVSVMGIGVWGGWGVEKSKAGIITQPGPRISLTVWHDDILGFKLYFLDTGGACTSDESNDGNNWAVIPSYLKGDSYHKHQSLGVTNRLHPHGNCGKLVLTLGTIKMFRSTGPEIAWLCNMQYAFLNTLS